MVEEEQHPITTQKGAGAVAILLGVVSVFAPFFLDLGSAFLIGIVAIVVIAWIYWSEVSLSFKKKSWSKGLNVPVVAIAAVVLMGFLSVNRAANAPKLPAAINTDEIAQRVGVWMQQHSAPPPQNAPSKPSPITYQTVYRIEVPGASKEAVPKTQLPATPAAKPEAESANAEFARLMARNDLYNKKYKELTECESKTLPIQVRLRELHNDAVNYLNDWAYNRDADKLSGEYKSWVGEVRELFAEHQDSLKDVSEFEKLSDKAVPKNGIFRRDGGQVIWDNFNERRKVILSIFESNRKSACKAQSDAIDAFNKSRDQTAQN